MQSLFSQDPLLCYAHPFPVVMGGAAMSAPGGEGGGQARQRDESRPRQDGAGLCETPSRYSNL